MTDVESHHGHDRMSHPSSPRLVSSSLSPSTHRQTHEQRATLSKSSSQYSSTSSAKASSSSSHHPKQHGSSKQSGHPAPRWLSHRLSKLLAFTLVLAALGLLYSHTRLAELDIDGGDTKTAQARARFEEHQQKQSSLHSAADEALIRAPPSRAFCRKARPPLVCAHGGDSSHAPPNTREAFEAALACGADCVEVDVARTKDDQLVVLHIRELHQLLDLQAQRQLHSQGGGGGGGRRRHLQMQMPQDRPVQAQEAHRGWRPFASRQQQPREAAQAPEQRQAGQQQRSDANAAGQQEPQQRKAATAPGEQQSEEQQQLEKQHPPVEAAPARPQVGDFTLEELQELRWSGGEEIMTVADAVALTSPAVNVVTLDIKTYQGQDGQAVDELQLAESIVELMYAQRCSNCLVWAKSDLVVQHIKHLSKGQRVGYIVMNETHEALEAGMHMPLRMAEPEVVGVHAPMVDSELLELLHDGGKHLYAWTANTAASIQELLDVGVDGIVTNHPAMALEAIGYRLDRCGGIADPGGTARWSSSTDGSEL